MNKYDIIIVGGGVVGATAALALGQNPKLKIALVDSQVLSSKYNQEIYDYRVSAISLSSKKILQNLSVWDAIKSKRISPYTHMQVWDESGNGKINFACDEVNQPVLGYIIEDNVIRYSLYEVIQNFKNIDCLFPVKLSLLTRKDNAIELQSADQQIFQTQCLIAADGANSWVRENAGFSVQIKSYEHTAIVATVRTELPHQNTARQVFLSQGPLAFLPLADPHLSSIVWSSNNDYANWLLTLDNEEFCTTLATQFSNKLDRIVFADRRYHFPLVMRHAKNYIQDNLVLIGDAAHTIHPLAGQGVNLGLLDAASLAEIILKAHEKNRNFASFATLRQYERWRKTDNLMMLKGIDVIKNLFASNKKSLQIMRQTGLNLTNHIKPLKTFFINHALGQRQQLPELAK